MTICEKSISTVAAGVWLDRDHAIAAHADAFDGALAERLSQILLEKSVADFGCGSGVYVDHLRSKGIDAFGYDGGPAVTACRDGQVLDLSQPVSVPVADWVLSLEVGEHIPASRERTFISNLHRHNREGIVLSWAIEGQSGTGHVNCRNNDYLIDVVQTLGYQFDATLSQTLRDAATKPWFKNTLMVFRRMPTPPAPQEKVLNCFDRAYVVNVVRDADRMQRASTRLERLGASFERFPALLPPADGVPSPSPAFKPGYWACAASHKALLELILERGHETALILEDDAVFRDDTAEWIEKMRPQLESTDWDLFYLGLHLVESAGWVADNLGRVKRGYHSHAYAVRRTAIPRLIACIDRVLANPVTTFDGYEDATIAKLYAIPILAVQEPNHSHTYEKGVNRLPQYFTLFDAGDFERHCLEMQGWAKDCDSKSITQPAPATTESIPSTVSLARAMALHKSGTHREAERLYEGVLEKEPDNAQALHYSRLLLNQLGRNAEAIDRLTRALVIDSSSPEYHNNFAVALGGMRRNEEALELLDEAVGLKADYAEAHFNRGIMLEKLGRADEAMLAWGTAAQIKPDYAEAHRRLGDGFLRLKRSGDAIRHLTESLRLAPGQPEARLNLGNALRERGELHAAAAAYRDAAEQRPGWADAHSNLGAVLHQLGNLDEALISLHKAVELRNDSADAHWNLALALLARGDFERGWLEYEWRRRLKEDRPQQRSFPQPEWNGGSIDGRTILVLCEQGLGDTIQFVRYLSMLKERGANVVLECQPKLRPLLEGVEGADRVVARGEPLPRFDTFVRILSLPGIFQTRVATIPARIPYLRAGAKRVTEWTRHVTRGNFKIGISWKGSDVYKGDRFRSMSLAEFAPLAAVPGVCLYSLQKGTAAEEIKTVGFKVEIFDRPRDEGCGAFLDTAAVLMKLDLVISSDTSMVHLAGALGVPVWVALAFSPDWRWLIGRDDCPWYPTMRLFRQASPGEWDGVFRRMAEVVPELTRAGNAALPTPPILAPVSPGHLIDRISILTIKSEHLGDPVKLAHIRTELDALIAVRTAFPRSTDLAPLESGLRETNEVLWRIEDELRECERLGNFGPRFVELARSVYQTNDRRCDLKRRIDQLFGSQIVEERIYTAGT